MKREAGGVRREARGEGRGAPVAVVGGGLAGSEAAWQLASRGFDVTLHEMRPVVTTPAHKTDRLAELVCSNTFKSTELTNAHGLLKAEMRLLGSIILDAADSARVQAGSALAVDRDVFSSHVSAKIAGEARID
ncbi:MAG TPA: FAD-dependent oxidoreductase, partial [Gemmatimonadaceae bacterium]